MNPPSRIETTSNRALLPRPCPRLSFKESKSCESSLIRLQHSPHHRLAGQQGDHVSSKKNGQLGQPVLIHWHIPIRCMQGQRLSQPPHWSPERRPAPGARPPPAMTESGGALSDHYGGSGRRGFAASGRGRGGGAAGRRAARKRGGGGAAAGLPRAGARKAAQSGL